MLQTTPRRAGLTSVPHIGYVQRHFLHFYWPFVPFTAHGHPWPAVGGEEPRGNTYLQMQRWGPLSPACSKHSAPPLCAIRVTQLLLNSKSAFLEPAFHLKVPTTNTLEKEMATHSSILVWRTPWTEEPGEYSPWGHRSLRVRHDWATNTHTHTHHTCY